MQTRVYIAVGDSFGGDRVILTLNSKFLNVVTKEMLAQNDEVSPYNDKIDILTTIGYSHVSCLLMMVIWCAPCKYLNWDKCTQEVIEIVRERAIPEALEDIDVGKHFKLEDVEQLMAEIGNMRHNVRS
ncbi:hypothetical protein Tco_0087026 [Tanacetum coccineum]